MKTNTTQKIALALMAILMTTSGAYALAYAVPDTTPNVPDLRQQQAQALAQQWVLNSPAYNDGGTGLTLSASSVTDTEPKTYIFTFAYTTPGQNNPTNPSQTQTITYCTYCQNQGYTNTDKVTSTGQAGSMMRRGQAGPQEHTITLTVMNGYVQTAVLDTAHDIMGDVTSYRPYGALGPNMNSAGQMLFVTMSYPARGASPWDTWYNEETTNKWRFTSTPSEGDIMQAYYTTNQNVPLYDIRMTNDGYAARVRYRDMDKLQFDGWRVNSMMASQTSMMPKSKDSSSRVGSGY